MTLKTVNQRLLVGRGRGRLMAQRSRETYDEEIHTQNVSMRSRYQKRKKKKICIKIGRSIKAASENLRGLEQKLLFP